MRVYHGTYGGNGQASQVITHGGGFQAKLYFVGQYPSASNNQYRWLTGSFSGNNHGDFLTTGSGFSNNGQLRAFTPTTFTVAGGFNTNGVTYYYTALSVDEASLRVGYYAGDGSSPRNITCGAGSWTPDWVYIVTTETGKMNVHWPQPIAAYDSNLSGNPMASANWTANYVRGTHADGFIVGANLNTSGQGYYWFALKNSTGNVHVNKYTGTGADNRNVVMPDPFQPTKLIMMGRWTGSSTIISERFRDHSCVGDQSHQFGAMGAVPQSNQIQEFNANGFQVGTAQSINANGSEWYYLAFRDHDPNEYFSFDLPSHARALRNFYPVICSFARKTTPLTLQSLPLPFGMVGLEVLLLCLHRRERRRNLMF